MAKESEKRKGFWDDEDEDSSPSPKTTTKTGIPSAKAPQRTGSLGIQDSESIDQKIHDTKILMEQTHKLYQQYFNGVEKRTPVEKAKFLEARVKEMERLSGSTPTARFKVSQFIIQYHTMRDLWERKLREKERK